MMNVEIVLYKEPGFEEVPFRFFFRFQEENKEHQQPIVCITGPWEDDYIEYRNMTSMVAGHFHQLIYDVIDYIEFRDMYKELESGEMKIAKVVGITNIVVWLNNACYIDYHGKKIIARYDESVKSYILELDGGVCRLMTSTSEIMPYLYLLNDNLKVLAVGLINGKLKNIKNNKESK